MEVVASISPVLYQKIAVSQEKNMKVALEKYDVKIVLSSYGLPSLACQSSVDIRTEIGIKWHVLPRFAEKCITSMENTIENSVHNDKMIENLFIKWFSFQNQQSPVYLVNCHFSKFPDRW